MRILLDLRAFDHWTSYAHRRIVAHDSFDIEALTDNVVLFKYGAARAPGYEIFLGHILLEPRS